MVKLKFYYKNTCLKSFSELKHCLILQVSFCQSHFIAFFFLGGGGREVGLILLFYKRIPIPSRTFCKPADRHLRHNFLLRLNPMCSLSPWRKRLCVPETCPTFLIILADLMTLVERSDVLFCIGLWGIILTNLWNVKISYTPLQRPPIMIVCKSVTFFVPHPEMQYQRITAWKLLTNLEEPVVTGEVTWESSWPVRSCLNTQVASKISVLRRNANRAAASQKHIRPPVCTP